MDQKMKLKAKRKYYKLKLTEQAPQRASVNTQPAWQTLESKRRKKEPRGVRGRYARGEGAPVREAYETTFLAFLECGISLLVKRFPTG